MRSDTYMEETSPVLVVVPYRRVSVSKEGFELVQPALFYDSKNWETSRYDPVNFKKDWHRRENTIISERLTAGDSEHLSLRFLL